MLRNSTSRQAGHMRRIAHLKAHPWQCRIRKKRVDRTACAVTSVDVAKDVEHRLHSAHGGEKLAASSVILGAGHPVEDAMRRTMSDQDIHVVGNTGVELRSIAFGRNPKGFPKERSCR